MARVLRPRGNKGEVAVELLTDFPERLTKLKEIFLGRARGEGFAGAFGAEEPQADRRTILLAEPESSRAGCVSFCGREFDQ